MDKRREIKRTDNGEHGLEVAGRVARSINEGGGLAKESVGASAVDQAVALALLHGGAGERALASELLHGERLASLQCGAKKWEYVRRTAYQIMSHECVRVRAACSQREWFKQRACIVDTRDASCAEQENMPSWPGQ